MIYNPDSLVVGGQSFLFLDNAKKCLAFLPQAYKMSEINAAMQHLPPHSGANIFDDTFLEADARVFANLQSTQFYDNNTTLGAIRAGMQGVQD